MDDTAIQRYFSQPTHTYQRQYEALRAVFLEQRSHKEVADQFGFKQSAMRQLVYEFRKNFSADASPFFRPSPSVALPQSRRRSSSRL
jgi:hypothetical protein